MDETKWKAVPVEPTREMLGAWYAAKANTGRDGPAYHDLLAAAPTTHVAVKRELLEEISTECAKCYKIMGGNIEHAPTQYGYGLIWSKLRALLSTEG